MDLKQASTEKAKFNSFVCQKCKKTFKYKSELTKHLNNKKPCVKTATEIIIEQPICVFCDKKFSSIASKNKHIKKCRERNVSKEILLENKILKEHVAMLTEQIEFYKSRLDEIDNQKVVTSVVNNVVNNVTNNASISITVNNFNTPNIDKVVITYDELIKTPNIHNAILERVYFNSDIPENKSIKGRISPTELYVCIDEKFVLVPRDAKDIFSNIREVITDMKNKIWNNPKDNKEVIKYIKTRYPDSSDWDVVLHDSLNYQSIVTIASRLNAYC